MFDELLKNPLLQKALSAGEERVGRAVAALLSNEKFLAGFQSAMSSAMQARAAVEKGVRSAMQAANLPTTEDVADIKRRLAELESIIDDLAARIEQRTGEPPGEREQGEGKGAGEDQGLGPSGPA